MTKLDIVKILNEQIGFSKRECQELVELVFESIKEVLVNEGKLKISRFGIFEVREKKERKGRNPQTNEEVIIPPRKVLVFRPSPHLKNKINGKV